MTFGWLDLSNLWTYAAAYWLLLIAIALIELRSPIHRNPHEPGGRLVTNFGLGLIEAGMFAAVPISLVATAQWAQARGIGLFNLLPLPWVVAGLATLVVRSLAGYWIHRISHAIPLLWRVHRIHHCDVAVDLSTGFRHHPFETVVVVVALLALVLLFGLSPIPLALYETLAAGFALWSHANLQLPRRFERLLRSVLITPDMHHVHHSASQMQTDSNYGDILSIWDRLFDTYCDVDRHELQALRFGLGDGEDADAAHLLRQLRAPLRRQAGRGREANRNTA